MLVIPMASFGIQEQATASAEGEEQTKWAEENPAEEQADWDDYETMELMDLSKIRARGLDLSDVDELDDTIRGEEKEKYDFIPDRKTLAPLIEKMYPNIDVEALNLYTRPVTGDPYWWNGDTYFKIWDEGTRTLTPVFVKAMEESGFGLPLDEYLPESFRKIRRLVEIEQSLQSARLDLQRERQVLRQSQTLSEQAALRESINQLEDQIETLETEREEAESKLPLRSRVRAILTRYKYRIGGFVVAAGLVAGVIVLSTKNAVGSVMTAAGNGLDKLGQTAAKQLPAIIGAVAGFVLRAVGSALAFLGKNAWLVMIAIATFAVNELASSSGRSGGRRTPHQR